MIYIICGLIIGIVMGLTGAGGALIAIPLFIQFLDMSLKEASVFSLIAVVIASLSNFVAQKKFTDYKTGLIIIASSTVGSFVSSPFKASLPDIVVAILLSMVSLYALYGVWVPVKKSSSQLPPPGLVITIMIGLFLGVLTTFTGLGGGVLMMPVFLSFYNFDQNRAVATSLLAVSLSSLSSIIIQVYQGASMNLDQNLGLLIIGILFAAMSLKWLTPKMGPGILVPVRKILFTVVVIIALIKIF